MTERLVDIPIAVRQQLSNGRLLNAIDQAALQTLSTSREQGFVFGVSPLTQPPKPAYSDILPGQEHEYDFEPALQAMDMNLALPQIMAHTHPSRRPHLSSQDHSAWQKMPEYLAVYDDVQGDFLQAANTRPLALVIAPYENQRHRVTVMCQTGPEVDLSAYKGQSVSQINIAMDQLRRDPIRMVADHKGTLRKVKQEMGIDTRTFTLDAPGRAELEQYVFDHLPQQLVLRSASDY